VAKIGYKLPINVQNSMQRLSPSENVVDKSHRGATFLTHPVDTQTHTHISSYTLNAVTHLYTHTGHNYFMTH